MVSLASLASLCVCSIVSVACLSRLSMAALTSSLGLDVGDKREDFGWDGDVIEEEVAGGVAAP